MFALTVVFSVGLVAWAVSSAMRKAFDRFDTQRTNALVAQFRREFAQRGEEVTRQVEGIANAEDTLTMAVALNRANSDYSVFVNQASVLAPTHQLDFLELLADDGTIVSSAQWPARFGYKEEWVAAGGFDGSAQGPFLKREELPEGVGLALEAVSVVRAGDKKLYVVGGRRLGRDFLASLVLPAGTRTLLYHDVGGDPTAGSVIDVAGPVPQARDKLLPLISSVRQPTATGELAQTVTWTTDSASAETFHAVPLLGLHNEVLGMFLVGSSRREQIELQKHIRSVAFLVAGAGILLGMALSAWSGVRVTKPVEGLAAAAQEVARGNWNVQVEGRSSDELGQLAQAFNRMTRQLVEQRDRLVQAERVAAWRELARRLAHELKNPLFPLQITVENLLRARERDPGQFEEVFHESTSTLLAELANLRTIIGRFSDFAKMPPPQLQPVSANDVVRGALKLFEAQLSPFCGTERRSDGSDAGKLPINTKIELAENLPTIQADPDLLHRAVQNLVLNALDAMPSGGTLTLCTRPSAGGVQLEVSDSGKGLTKEECERLFTPYYTTKQHGTGLGLAVVQSVVSDHGGKISVESEPDRGTTFRIDLPVRPVASG